MTNQLAAWGRRIVPMASGSFVDGTRGGDDDGPIKVQTTLWDAVDFASAVSQEGYTVGDESLMYDALTINFILQRKSGFSVRRDVAYAVLFVFMSYVGFFVDSKAAPARAALAVIPVLTMLNHLNSVERSLPPLSSSTWLTSFLMLSLVYTAIAVLELAVISATLGIERRRAGRMATFEKLAKRMQDVSNPLNDRERKLFQTFFKTIDSGGLLCDSDGTISVTELKAGLRHFNIYYSLEQCSDVIELVRSQHASVSGLRRPSLSGGAQEDFDVPPAPAAQPRVARAPWESPPAPSAPAAPPSPGDTEFALVAAAPHHAHTLVAAAGASATAVGAAAQSHQQSQRKSLASSGAATMCPVFPRALGCFGSSMPRPESSQETPLSIRQQAHQPQLHVDPGLQKQQVPRDVGPSSCAHQSSSGHSISNLEFRTLLIMFENGSIHPTPPCVTKLRGQKG
ncbi:unnamed protein product [Prorocentrum cordatum]|uniref:Neurotransmitter-gated ion-channel transmembrane domain-containing protein n=1 Tax=Prorocentrum cordatum TaxID=2364126 RepID=A0ABN9SPF1_9DINO|nr:unnamed protein product [Polarella glacialis]